ncbi:MAG: M28 family peptidase [Balneolaceae bacterium]
MKHLPYQAWFAALSLFLIPVFFTTGCQKDDVSQSQPDFLRENIEWLAAGEREGRLAGTIHEADAANYIADRFLQFGVIPAGDDETYFQEFLLSGPVVQAMSMENHISRNVVGMVRGSQNPEQFIILGAHYDSQGMGGVISMNGSIEPSIHNGADDNASGTTGVLYLAKQLAENPAEKSILLIAFSGEEMGLIGSRYFAENMEMSRDSILAMINLDMIGRLVEQELTIFGTGTANIWSEILESVESDSLAISTVPSGTGSSDHAAFYEIGIPSLHYFTGIHEDYHRDTDIPEKINYDGMAAVLSHAEQTVREISRYTPGGIEFTETTDPRESVMQRDGVTLGVLPDYSYSGEGFRIEGIREGQPADNAGIEEGDIIIRMGENEVEDIYDYMELLGEYRAGDSERLVIRRGEEEIELDVIF